MTVRPGDAPASPPPPRPTETAVAAVRAELRAALGDLSATLAAAPPPNVGSLYDSLRHTWILADLAELDEAADARLKTVLRSLHRELRAGGQTLDAHHFAHHLAGAADQL